MDDRIIVTGHTDDLPIRTAQFPSNWELSTARAGSVIRHFLTNGDIEATRFLAVGMADTLPRVPNDSAVNRAQNRRVEIAFQKSVESLSIALSILHGQDHLADRLSLEEKAQGIGSPGHGQHV